MKVDSVTLYAALMDDATRVFHARIFGYKSPCPGGELQRELVSGLLFTNDNEGLFPDKKINMLDCTVIVIPKGPLKEAVRQGASIEDLITVLGDKEEWRDKP